MADVAVGYRHKLDVMALLGPHGRHATALVLSIIWMSTEADNVQLAIVRRRYAGTGLCLQPMKACAHGEQEAECKYAQSTLHRGVSKVGKKLRRDIFLSIDILSDAIGHKNEGREIRV